MFPKEEEKRGFSFALPTNDKRGFSFAFPSNKKRGFSFAFPSEKRGFSFALPKGNKRGFSFAFPSEEKRGFSYSFPKEKRVISFALPRNEKRGFSFAFPSEEKRGFSYAFPSHKRGFSFALPKDDKRGFSFAFPSEDKRGFSYAFPAEKKYGMSLRLPTEEKRGFSYSFPKEDKRGFSYSFPKEDKRGFSFAFPSEADKRGFSFSFPRDVEDYAEKRGFSFALPKDLDEKRGSSSPRAVSAGQSSYRDKTDERNIIFTDQKHTLKDDHSVSSSSEEALGQEAGVEKRGFSFVFPQVGDALIAGHQANQAHSHRVTRVKMATAPRGLEPTRDQPIDWEQIMKTPWRAFYHKRSAPTGDRSKEEPIQSDNFLFEDLAEEDPYEDDSNGMVHEQQDKRSIALLVTMPTLGLQRIHKSADASSHYPLSISSHEDAVGRIGNGRTVDGVSHRLLLPPRELVAGPLNGKSLSRKWKISRMLPEGFFQSGVKRSALQSSIKVKYKFV